MKYYRHFEVSASCDWLGQRGAPCFQFNFFDLSLHFHRDDEMTMVTLSIGFLGLGAVLDVGHWPDWGRLGEGED